MSIKHKRQSLNALIYTSILAAAILLAAYTLSFVAIEYFPGVTSQGQQSSGGVDFTFSRNVAAWRYRRSESSDVIGRQSSYLTVWTPAGPLLPQVKGDTVIDGVAVGLLGPTITGEQVVNAMTGLLGPSYGVMGVGETACPAGVRWSLLLDYAMVLVMCSAVRSSWLATSRSRTRL
jgi:hypothetical protein